MVNLGAAIRTPAACRVSSVRSSMSFEQKEDRRDAVYVATLPLRAPGPAQMLVSACYSLPLWEPQHFIVILKHRVLSSPEIKATVFDFQPCNPEAISVAIGGLFRQRIPGIIRQRSLKRIPKNRCWFVGLCNTDGLDVAGKFNQDWETELVVGTHDCRHYTDGLVEELTGKKHILEDLRMKWLDSR